MEKLWLPVSVLAEKAPAVSDSEMQLLLLSLDGVGEQPFKDELPRSRLLAFVASSNLLPPFSHFQLLIYGRILIMTP